jgi:hypothetical protein
MVLTKEAQAAQNLASRMNEGRKNIAHFTVDTRIAASAPQRRATLDKRTNVVDLLATLLGQVAEYEKELWANQRRPRRETRKNCGRINSTASTERVRPALFDLTPLRERK